MIEERKKWYNRELLIPLSQSFSLHLPPAHSDSHFPERLVRHHLPAALNPASVYAPLHEWLLCWHDCWLHGAHTKHTHMHPRFTRSSLTTKLKNTSANNLTWCVDTTPDSDQWRFFRDLTDTWQQTHTWHFLCVSEHNQKNRSTGHIDTKVAGSSN